MKGGRMYKYISVIILFLALSSPAKAQGSSLEMLSERLFGKGYVVRDNMVYYKWGSPPLIHARRSEKDIQAEERREERDKIPIPLADARTFKSLNLKYGMDHKRVFYFEDLIKGADPNTFTRIENSEVFYKDKDNVYLKGKVFEGADAATFRIHENENYMLDINNVYYQGVALDVDPEKFILLDDYLIGNDKVYYRGRLCANINTDSFRLLEKGYATDGNIVIYRGKLCPNMNANSFRLLEGGYATDGDIVLYDGELCPNMKANSFRLLEEGYVTDGNIVTFHGWLVLDADGSTFRKLLSSEGTSYMPTNHDYLYVDKYRLYLRDKPIDGSGPDNKILGEKHLISNDKVFYEVEIIPDADAGSFISLSEYWGKDKQTAYFRTKPVKGAGADSRLIGKYHLISNDKVFHYTDTIPGTDAGSFILLSGDWVKDKNAVYYKDIPVENADPASFEAIELGVRDYFGFDKNHFFEKNKILMKIDGSSFRHVKDFVYVDNNYVYVISDKGLYKIRADGKTFEKVYDDKRVDYKDKNHFYKYSKGKLKKVRKLKNRK